MFKLYLKDKDKDKELNYKEIVVKSGSSIKLTRCNPFYNEKGDFTLSVEIPLQGVPSNREVFGTPDRQEVSRVPLVGKTMEFRLVTDILTLDGTATVLKATERSVSVQLKSTVPLTDTNDLDGAGKYIDELDLGKAWEDVYKEYYYPGEQGVCKRKGIKPEAAQSHKWTLACILASPNYDQLLHGTCDQTDCVCFPIWSTEDKAWGNKHDFLCFGHLQSDRSYRYTHYGQAYIPWGEGSVADTAIPLPGQGRPEEWEKYIISDEYEEKENRAYALDRLLSPQPYLCFLVEKILSALGYELARKDNAIRQSEWMKRIFVANARRSLQIARCLPHWTVSDFFKHLRENFNLTVVVQGRQVKVLSRKLYYHDDTVIVPISDSADPHTTDISSEKNSSEASSGNVGYDFSDVVPTILNIGEDAYDGMVLSYKDDLPGTEELSKLSDEDKEGSKLLYISGTDNSERFGIFKGKDDQYSFVRVDHMGPVLRDKDTKIDLKLKMVPAMLTEMIPVKRRYMNFLRLIESPVPPKHDGFSPYSEYPVDTVSDLQRFDEGGELGGFYPPCLITADTRIPEKREAMNLQTWVKKNEDTSEVEHEKQDIMELALNYGDVLDVRRSSYLPVYIYDRDYEGMSKKTAVIPHPAGIPYIISRLQDGSGTMGETYPIVTTVDDPHYDFLLNWQTNIREEIDGGGWNIDTRCVFQVEFLDKFCDPMLPVLIRGRKYIPTKIEITIDENGVQPLKRGYFLEVNE